MSFPSFENDRASRMRAVKVRNLYDLILSIVKCAKQKRARKAALLCSKLMNHSLLGYLPQTSLFANMVSYHTSAGKFRKNSYKLLMKFAIKPLNELEKHVRASRHLVLESKPDYKSSKKPSSVVKLVKPQQKPTHTFSALEDLERIKQLVIEKKESVESIVRQERKKTQAPLVVKKQNKSKKSDEEQSEEAPQDIAKSISKDDAFVFKTLGKESNIIALDLGESRLLKRGVLMQKTHIPGIVWKTVFAQLGLQIVAKQYVTAVYAPILAVPAEESGEAYEPEAILNHANQFLASHNRKQKNDCMKLEVVGDPFKTRTSSHWLWLCMPKCVVEHVGFRMESWAFTNTPRIETAKMLKLA
jgi:hypothetical protein